MTSAAATKPNVDLDAVNKRLEGADALSIIEWASGQFGHGLVMSSSFGAESALMLHLATRVVPGIPVILVDTGYLFPETYVFAQELAERLKLNLKIYQAQQSPAWMEAVHGKLWEKQTKEALDQYDRLRKVEPMQRALRELGATAWLAGLRKHQTQHRAALRPVELQNGIYKVHPILGWTTKDIYNYLKKHGLPFHPLYEKGYKSIGDWHSTRPITEGDARDGRFLGLKQECGLHLPESKEEEGSRQSSSL